MPAITKPHEAHHIEIQAPPYFNIKVFACTVLHHKLTAADVARVDVTGFSTVRLSRLTYPD